MANRPAQKEVGGSLMADVSFLCPACGQHLACESDLVRESIECPECGAEISVPEPEGAQAPEETSEGESAVGDETAGDEVSAAAGEEGAERAAADESAEEKVEDGAEEEAKPAGREKEPDPVIGRYTAEDQPASVVKKLLVRIGESLNEQESIEYIAVPHNPINPLNNIEPACVVLTSHRLIICRPKLLGRMEFEDFRWTDVLDLHLAEKLTGATLSFRAMTGETVGVDHIPKKQARKLYAIAQRCEEGAREQRRQRNAGQMAAGLASHAAAARPTQPASDTATKDDPVLRLKQIKEMLDLGLITKQDYVAKKKNLLDEL
jgi:hypothetical protein